MQSRGSVKSMAPSTPTHASKESDSEDVDLQSKSGALVENGKDIYLVDWYGPDDPEVRASPTPCDM